jgi:hypothetical protein
MYDYNVPCFLQLGHPSCPKRAEWVVYFEHVEPDDACVVDSAPAPLCTEHKDFIVASFSGFWRMWLGAQLTTCPTCAKPFHISRVDPIKPKG